MNASVGSMMVLSVYLSHGGHDQACCITDLDLARIIMDEGKNVGAKDFFIGGDLSTEFRLEGGGEELQGLDSLDWYSLYGLECEGGGEDVKTYEKTLRWLQLLRDFNCAVTSTWGEV